MERLEFTDAALMAYLDGAMASDALRALEERLASDSYLRMRVSALRESQEALAALGETIRAHAPTVDLAGSVLRQAARIRQEEAAASADADLERELEGLGIQLRAASPSVDLCNGVMRHLSDLPREAGLLPLALELTETGRDLRAAAPRVQVAEPVMRRVKADAPQSLPGNVVPLSRSRKPARRKTAASLSWKFTAAAAACVIVTAAFIVYRVAQPVTLGTLDIALKEAPPAHPQPAAIQESPRSADREAESFGDLMPQTDDIAAFPDVQRPAPAKDIVPAGSADAQAVVALTADDLITARREALGGNLDSLTMLARWGALDPDKVRQLLAEGALSFDDLVGLSRFLPAEDARELLQQALGQQPDNPYLRYALARNLMDDPSRHAEALQHLAMLKSLAPDNSLPYYMDAQILFARGDYAAGLQALEYASMLGTASAYGLAAAQFHSAALQAAGYSPEVAEMLAAFNAGSSEYGAVTALGFDLLNYGNYLESIGDHAGAATVYKAVRQLGLQVDRGADFTNEMLAGLDLQMASIEALNALTGAMDIPGGLQTVENAYAVFTESLNFFLQYTTLFDHMMTNSSSDFIMRMMQIILRRGDLYYLRKTHD